MLLFTFCWLEHWYWSNKFNPRDEDYDFLWNVEIISKIHTFQVNNAILSISIGIQLFNLNIFFLSFHNLKCSMSEW